MVTFERPDRVKDEEMRSVTEYLLDEHRMVFIRGVIGGTVADLESSNLILALAAHSADPIKLFITSPGGVVDTAMMIYDTIRLVDVPIITIGRFCASAAAILMAAGAKRYLFPRAKMMLHLPSGQLQGDSTDVAIGQKEMEKTLTMIVSALIECGVKKTPRKIKADIQREFWFSPQEAIDYGLADEIVTKELLKGWLGK